MKDLLIAIKQQLQNNLTWVRKGDIFITEDEYLLPKAGRFPAISLKDGTIGNTPQTNQAYKQQAQVRVSLFVSIKKPEESLIGSQGVLALAETTIDCLIQNALAIPDVYSAFPLSEDASEMFGDETEMIQKKTITLQYERQKALPKRS